MSRVVEHLAELTGFRDRDVLDVTLAGALRDLLQPEEVAIYHAVGEPGNEVWLTRARMARGDRTARADPLWPDLSSLPPLASEPDRLDCLRHQRALAVAGAPARAYFPVTTEIKAVSVLELRTARPLAPADLRLVGSILRIYRNFQGLLDYSERDTLTGLLNRKTFDDSFLRVAAPLSASGVAPDIAPDVAPDVAPGTAADDAGASPDLRRLSPHGSLWLAVIDIDHFKRVNDTHGHLIGDEVLLLLSRLMRSTFRFHDHLYRFGGEEFVVLMRCTDADAAMAALERLRENVAGYRFPQVEHITVSAGLTAVRPEDTPSAAFERADQALYHVKGNGRNAVADHARLVAEGRLANRENVGNIEMF